MIIGSLLLILVAVVMLGLGLVRGSNAFLIGSIVASLFAAILLIVGARQAAARRAAAGREFGGDDPDLTDTLAGQADARIVRDGPGMRGQPPRQATARSGPAGGPDGLGDRDGMAHPMGGDTMVEEEPTVVSIPTQSRMGMHPGAEREELDDDYAEEDPPDEPAVQVVSPADAARVARMNAEVLVVDGRPRYHRKGCVHMLGRESEPLPVGEAVELGFTPCGLCEPDSALLSEARRA